MTEFSAWPHRSSQVQEELTPCFPNSQPTSSSSLPPPLIRPLPLCEEGKVSVVPYNSLISCHRCRSILVFLTWMTPVIGCSNMGHSQMLYNDLLLNRVEISLGQSRLCVVVRTEKLRILRGERTCCFSRGSAHSSLRDQGFFSPLVIAIGFR